MGFQYVIQIPAPAIGVKYLRQAPGCLVAGPTADAHKVGIKGSGTRIFSDGFVQQDNFEPYPVLRMSQMPGVAVHIVPSSTDPTGVDEPGLPSIAPAVANALPAATGKCHRRLPLNPASNA